MNHPNIEATDATLERLMLDMAKASPEHRVNPELESFLELLHVMGDPQDSLQTVIVGGTNGKTSTSRMIESILSGWGYSVGLYTSPHLEHVRERIRINGDQVSVEALVDSLTRIDAYSRLTSDGNPKPTYFETLTAAALEIMADSPVDFAVLEVGMGGRWDATNVTTPTVACLLPISLDHMEFLGDTIEKIAADKSYIVKEGSVCVVGRQVSSALEVIKRRCNEQSAKMFVLGNDFEISNRREAIGGQLFDIDTPFASFSDVFVPLLGEHQVDNAAVAVMAAQLAVGSSQRFEPNLLPKSLEQTSSPGRLEILGREPLVVLDVCHNPAGADATAKALGASFGQLDFLLIFGAMRDKDVLGVLKPLLAHCNEVILTAANSRRAFSVGALGDLIHAHAPRLKVHKSASVAQACDMALRMASSRGVLVAGSVALVGEARTYFSGAEDDDQERQA